MNSILGNGIIKEGQVKVDDPIHLPDGSEVTIVSRQDNERLMTSVEIAQTLAAMARIEPFDISDEERFAADAWEKEVNEYSIRNLDNGIEEVFR